MFRDIKYAWRLLLKTPAFTLLTIGVMAIGLGLAIYMFSIIHMFAYKQLDIPQYHRLMMVDAVIDGMQSNGGSVFAHDYDYMKKRQQSFDVFGAYINITFNLSNGEQAKRYDGSLIEPQVFNLMGAKPLLGRVFSDEDVKRTFYDSERNPSHSDVVIIGYHPWQDFFAGDRNIIGKTVQVNGRIHKIIAVMPEGFSYPTGETVWLPMKVAADQKPGLGGWKVSVAAQLKPNISFAAGQQELSTLARELAERYPETNTNIGVHCRTLVQVAMDNSMMVVHILTGATLFILILIIVNVGNLMLSRAMERNKEVAIRYALGAPRERVVRQLLLETIIICCIGGFFGILIAGWGLDISRPIFQSFGGRFSWWTFELGADELSIAAWTILSTAVITGLLPAIKASDTNINSALRDGTRGAQSKEAGKMTKVLVSAEIFLCCTLLILAGGMILGVNDALNADYGFKSKNILTARFGLNTDSYINTKKRFPYHQKLMRLLEQQPGIEQATTASVFPGQSSGRESVGIEGMENQNKEFPRPYFITIANNYFELLGVPILEGRAFNDKDTLGSLPVVIVSANFANKYWPDGNAVGKRIKTDVNNPDSRWLTIVGVSKQLLHSRPFGQEQFRSAIYVPNSQLTYQYQYVGIKTSLNPYQLQQALINTAAQVDANIPVYSIFSLSDRLQREIGSMGFLGLLFNIFGILALILAAAGIYGMMSRSVALRTQEFGVRQALGAVDKNIYQLLLKQSAAMLLFGLTLGSILGYFAAKIVSNGDFDQYYMIVASTVLLIISITFVAATLLPAFKSLRMQPGHALHYE